VQQFPARDAGNLKTTAIYLRVSTEEQAKSGFSIPAQKEKLTSHCKRQNWIYETFEDAGYSAGSLNRPAIQCLIQKIKEQKIERVVVWKLDRLSRRMSNLYQLISLFEKHNVELVSLSENISSDLPMGKLLTGILGSVAEFERESIRERVRAVRDSRIKIKGLPLGNPPFGYSKNWQVIPEQAQVVREMFEMAQYAGFTKIARILNERGIRTRDGNPWTNVAISRILNNSTYAGLIELDGSFIKGRFSPIVPESLFFTVRTKIKARRRKQDASASPHLLTGILRCGLCGRGMVICGDYKAGKSFYICRTKAQKGAFACKNRRFKADFVEDMLGKVIHSRVVSPNRHKIIEKIRQKSTQKEFERLKKERAELETAIKTIRKKLGRLYVLFEEEGIEMDVLLERVGQLKQQKGALEEKLRELDERIAGSDVERLVATCQEALEKFQLLWDIADTPSKKVLLNTLIKKMIAYPEHIVVEFIWGETVKIEYPREKPLVQVSELERKQLERCNKIQAKIVLMAADGMRAKDICNALNVDFSKVLWVLGRYREKEMAYIRNARELRPNQSIPRGIRDLICSTLGTVKNLSLSELKRFLSSQGFSVSNQMLKNIVYNYIPSLVWSKNDNVHP